MMSGTSAGAGWSLQRSRTTSLRGVVLSRPGDAPASLPATTTLNTHAILLDASSLTSAALGRFESLFGREVAGFGWARGLVL